MTEPLPGRATSHPTPPDRTTQYRRAAPARAEPAGPRAVPADPPHQRLRRPADPAHRPRTGAGHRTGARALLEADARLVLAITRRHRPALGADGDRQRVDEGQHRHGLVGCGISVPVVPRRARVVAARPEGPLSPAVPWRYEYRPRPRTARIETAPAAATAGAAGPAVGSGLRRSAGPAVLGRCGPGMGRAGSRRWRRLRPGTLPRREAAPPHLTPDAGDASG